MNEVDRAAPEWFERANFGGIGDGNMALRRAVFASWPGFEEGIGRGMPVCGGEEHYAFFALIERGHRVARTLRLPSPEQGPTVEITVRPHPAAWYNKHQPTFSDAIAAVRRVLWSPPSFSMCRSGSESIEIPVNLLNRFVETLCLAA